LRFEDEFDVWLRVTAIKTKTIQFACLLTRDDTKIATGSLTIACASQQPNQPLKAIPIPPDIAARFQVAPGLET
jgi:acyl-CoA thioesterase FadM